MRIMRRDACALLRIMPYAVMRIISVRTFAYYAHMRMCFVDAHNIEYAHNMRILSVDAHNMSGRHILCRGAIMRGNDICAENAHVRR